LKKLLAGQEIVIFSQKIIIKFGFKIQKDYVKNSIMKIIKNVEVVDTAFGGFGVVKVKNMPVIFVPKTVEKDVIDLEILKSKKSYSFGKLLNIVKPSPYRIQPNCKYTDICGGCSFGFIDYNYQIKIKEKIVKNFFRNFNGFKIDKIIKSPQEGYRFRANFKLFKNKFGFLKFKTHEFLEIEECKICKPSIIEKIKSFLEYFNFNKLTNCYIIENEKNEALVRIDLHLNLEKFNLLKVAGIKSLNSFKGKNYIEINVNDNSYFAGFNSFSQSNRFLLKDFLEISTNFIDKSDNVLELYSGSGFFTNKISKIAKNVIAVENNNEAIELLKLKRNTNVHIINKNVNNLSFENFKNFNVLFVDPPRSGLTDKIIKNISKKRFEKIIYVSCNPSTLARDIYKLKPLYKIEKCFIVDMFPNTHHIELVIYLKNFL